MSASRISTPNPAESLFVDSLDSEIDESLKDPQYRAVFEDATHRHELMDLLVDRRRERNLTQKQVAERMGVGQSTVAGFENEGSDPRLSTVQRYARAVEARCVVTVQVSMNCDWVRSTPKYHENRGSGHSTRVDSSSVGQLNLSWAATAANSPRTSFALVA